MTHRYTILHGGTVLTLAGAPPSDARARRAGDPTVPDAAGRRATAICIAEDRILALGDDASVLALAGPDSTLVDLRGRCVVPGLIDPHAHPYAEGLAAAVPSLVAAPDLRTLLRSVPGLGEHLGPDAWLVARYDDGSWPESRSPTRDDLDRVVPDRPVLLGHRSGHAVVANSLALVLAGIGVDGPADAASGVTVVRDQHGEPTGLIEGPGAWALVAAGMPARRPAERAAALRLAAGRLARDGVTWVADADAGSSDGLEHELAAYGAAVEAGTFPIGLGLLPGLAGLAPAPESDPPAPPEVAALLPAAVRDLVLLDRAKLYADGALTTRTAWLTAGYADAPGAGRPVHGPGALAERVRRATDRGWLLATHAIGDAAIGAVLDAYEAAAGAAGRPVGHRIDHAMLLTPALVARLAAGRIGVVVQPEFTRWAGDMYVRRLDASRAALLLPYATLLEAGVPLAFSSDRPIVGGAPLDGIRAALRHAGPSGRRLAEGPTVSPAEALHAWTSGAAGAAGIGAEAGRLEPGTRADLAILTVDPTALPPGAWAAGEDGVAVVATLVAGRVVAGDLAALEPLDRGPTDVAAGALVVEPSVGGRARPRARGARRP